VRAGAARTVIASPMKSNVPSIMRAMCPREQDTRLFVNVMSLQFSNHIAFEI